MGDLVEPPDPSRDAAARLRRHLAQLADPDVARAAGAALDDLVRQLGDQALHDPLTGLANRALLHDRLLTASARARRNGTDLAVLLFDVDHFRQVNDTLGHAAGDRLLVGLVERIRSRLRAQDSFARVGGDEFVVVIEGLERPSEQAVATVSDDLVAALARPLEVEGHQMRMTSSVGVVVSDGDEDPEELLRAADVALYAAKDDGRARWVRHAAALSEAARGRFEVHERILNALETGGFDLHYQPIVDLEHGTHVGVEALVRLRTPDGTVLSPGQFLGVAEDHGLIGRIGTEVLMMATRDCVHLSGMVAVNVSPSQLVDPDFERTVVRALGASGLPAERLVLDVTASAALDSPSAETTRNLNRLHARGVRFALDDFGSGFSSLDRLRHLPVSFLKIDRTFVDGLTTVGSGDLAVVRAIVGMAASLEIPVVAEGVEDELQRGILLRVGVQLAQGHLFSRAQPLADLLRSPALTTGVPVTDPR